MFQCKECIQSFELYDSLRRHVGRIHKIHASQSYITYVLDGIPPKCECGCGEPPRWRAGSFQRFINGHNSDGELNPMFGKHHSEEAKESISKKRKEKFANGEYRIWQNEKTPETLERIRLINEQSRKENNPERAQKISDALTGRMHSAEHNKNATAAIKKAWENPKLREQQRHNRVEYLKLEQFLNKSKLEQTFENLLISNNIQFESQHNANGFLFDFYVPTKNVLIEVDGDFWHSNPIKWPKPIYECQLDIAENDKVKNIVAKSAGYTLLRFWESDINENPQKVIQTLLDAIK